MATDFSAQIERLRHTYASIAAVTDPEALRARIAELSEQASAPDLWDDPDSAQVVTSALSHAQADLKRVESLGERIEDHPSSRPWAWASSASSTARVAGPGSVRVDR